MSVAAHIGEILRTNGMTSFPLDLTVRTLSWETGQVSVNAVTAQSLQEVVDIANGGNAPKIICKDVVLFPPGRSAGPISFRLHLPDTLKGHE